MKADMSIDAHWYAPLRDKYLLILSHLNSGPFPLGVTLVSVRRDISSGTKTLYPQKSYVKDNVSTGATSKGKKWRHRLEAR